MELEIVAKCSKMTRKSDGQDVALMVDFFYQSTIRYSYFIEIEKRKIIHCINPCIDYNGNVKMDSFYDILVKVENEIKEKFGELNTVSDVIEINEEEFAVLINHFMLKDELLKEIEKTKNELGDTCVYNYVKMFL